MFCLSPFCYVCLKNKEEFFNLNNIEADYMRLWDKLLYCMPEIEDIEDIPLFICRQCRRDLRVAYSFRKKFVKNFQYIDDYIRQLTYADGSEHADLCVTLVDCTKRLQYSTSEIKTECIGTESSINSINYYDDIQPEIDDEFSTCSDVENTFLCNHDDQSTDISSQSEENSNQSFQTEKLRENWEKFENTIENPAKRRKFDNSSVDLGIIDENDFKNDENIIILENSVVNLQNGSSDETSIVFNDHADNYDHLNDVSSSTVYDGQVQNVQNVSKNVDSSNSFPESEEQLVLNCKQAILTPVEQQNVQTQVANQDNNINNGNSNNPQCSKHGNSLKQLDSNESSNLQASCDNQPHSNNTEENTIDQFKTNIESSTVNPIKEVVQTKQCCKTDIHSDQKQANISQTQPYDFVTNELFHSLRNTNSTPANVDNDDDSSSRPSVATSMYESDIIDGENIDDYVSDNDELFQTDPETFDRQKNYELFQGEPDTFDRQNNYEQFQNSNTFDRQKNYEQFQENSDTFDRQKNYELFQGEPDTSEYRQSCNVSSVYSTDYSDISSPDDSAANSHMFSPNYETNLSHETNTYEHNQESSSVFPEYGDEIRQTVNDPHCSSATVVHIKSVTSDIEDNYSNETVLYQDSVQQDTSNAGENHSSQSVSKNINFSFLKAYLSNNTTANESVDVNASSKDSVSISSQEVIDKSNQNSVDEHVNNTVYKDSVDKCVETKKNVYTSIRKKIPRLIDLNGGIRNNISSSCEVFTCNVCNNKYSSKCLYTKHRELAHTVKSASNINTEDRNIQQEILQDCQEILKDSTCITESRSKIFAEDIVQTNRETNSATNNIHIEDISNTNNYIETNLNTNNIIIEDNTDTNNITKDNTDTNNLTKYKSNTNNLTKDSSNSNNLTKEYKCTICDMTFNYQSLLECHLERHTTKTVDPLPDIISNRRVVHAEHQSDDVEQYKCTVCGAQFHYKSLLACHLQTHKIRMSHLSRTNSSAVRNSLARYKIPHLNQSNRQLVNTKVDQSDVQQLVKNTKVDQSDVQSKNTVSSNEKIETNNKYIDNNTRISRNRIQEHSSHLNKIKMTDKPNVSDSIQTYSFTDAIEENMYRIHLGEIKHSELINKQCIKQSKFNNKQQTESVEVIREKSHNHTFAKTGNSNLTNNSVRKTVVDDNLQQISSTSSQSKVKLDKCPLCDKTFVNFNSLREHLIIQHKAYKKFQCTLCEKNFRQRSTLRYHMLNNHSNAELYVCPVCDKNFSGSFPLKRHMKCHYNEQPYKCTVCDKSFRYKESVKTHMALHTGVKPYKCPHCDKAFAFKGNMVKHMQTHTNQKRYPCQLCEKDFSTNFVMKQHMRIHTGERPHKCPICNRAFVARHTMVEHISTHTDEKPFQCTICTGRFKRKQHLRRHMYVHTEDRPYKCSVCDREFRLKNELNRHNAIHCSTNKPYTCDICNTGYSSKVKLYEHNFNIHYKKDISLNSAVLSENSHN